MEGYSPEKGPEKITREWLIAFARENPPREELEAKFKEWAKTVEVPRELNAASLETLDADIKHAAMKYRLRLLSQEEVLEELNELLQMVSNEGMGKPGVQKMHLQLSGLMNDIEDGIFE